MKSTLIPIAAVAMVLGAIVFGVAGVSAHGDSGDKAAALAEKLGVEQSEVEAAFAEIREEKKAEREAEFNAQLQEAVTNGELTQEQMDSILSMKADLQSDRQALIESGASKEEAREQMEAAREEFHDWLESQGIDLKEILDLPDKGKRNGRFHRGDHHGPGGDIDTEDDEEATTS